MSEDDDFCVGKLLRENEQERKRIMNEPFSLNNFWSFLIAGANQTQIREYLIKGTKELNGELTSLNIVHEEGTCETCDRFREYGKALKRVLGDVSLK